LPGVTGAALVLLPPLATGGWTSDYSVAGRPAGTYGTEVSHRQVSPGYFAVMRVPLLRGRLLTDADREGAPPVVVINEAMAREAFAGQDPIGQRLAFDKLPDSTSRWWTIVGVVGSERQASLAAPPATEAFQPYTQEANSYMTLVARTTGDPSGIVPAVRRVLAGLDPDLAPATLNTMEHLRASALATQRFLMFLLTAFAAVGLVLALVGVYGVIAQLARRRTREMGIRLALGASRAKLQWLVVRQGLGLALGGVAAGTGAALIATRLMRSLLYGVSSTDPATFFAVPLLLLGCALAATWLPAARASRVDPALTLREE
jgi:putative ABC transport system permease protein